MLKIEYDYKEQGYRIIDREFQLHELQLLIDSVQSSKFVTQKMAKRTDGQAEKSKRAALTVSPLTAAPMLQTASAV